VSARVSLWHDPMGRRRPLT